jgi:hypothetical protein
MISLERVHLQQVATRNHNRDSSICARTNEYQLIGIWDKSG